MRKCRKRIAVLVAVFLIFTYTAYADIEVHYLDVGQADCAIVVCDGHAMLIDGGNADDSSLVYSYLKNNLCIETLDYIIATHPHEDHIGGIAGALNACFAAHIYSPVSEWDMASFRAMVKYYGEQQGTIEKPPVGSSFFLGGGRVQILAPLRYDYEDVNDMSIVLKIVYGDTSFLFTGDAGYESEMDMLAEGYDLNADVLKVAHHGSSSATSQTFLDAVDPDYAIISVGTDNSYGHPHDETLYKLQNIMTYRTDQCGHIICKSDGTEITFEIARGGE